MLLHDAQLELPREKLAKNGVELLATEELIAILLQTGTREEHVLDLAKRVFVHLKNETYASYHTLKNIKGIGSAKACAIAAGIALGQRLEQKKKNTKIRNAQDVYQYAKHMYRFEQEVCKVLLLNTRNEIFKEIDAGKGTLDAAIIHPRDVFKQAIRDNASKIIIVHNHPSGNPEPSHADKDITRQLVKASKFIGIELLDHIIIGTSFFSFQEQGLLE